LKTHYLEIVEIINGYCIDGSKKILVGVYLRPGSRKCGSSGVLLEDEPWFGADVTQGNLLTYLLKNIEPTNRAS